MLVAGVDVGALWTKVVVLDGDRIAGSVVVPSGESTGETAEGALRAALEPIKATAGDLAGVVATGAGKNSVTAATDQTTEVVATARGVVFLHPGARGVIDMGGESTRVARLDADGKVVEFALNDKCAAGTGVFLDAMAKALGVPLEQMGPLSLESTEEVSITSMCVVYAESEVVSQVHRQTPKRDILRGIHRSIASRIASMASRVSLDGETVALGGLARNVGIVACLEEAMKAKLIVPAQPQAVGALGAALLAADKAGAR